MYLEACDIFSGELEKRFCDKQIPSILAIEKTLLNAANGLNYEATLEEIKKSCYKDDVNISDFNLFKIWLNRAVLK